MFYFVFIFCRANGCERMRSSNGALAFFIDGNEVSAQFSIDKSKLFGNYLDLFLSELIYVLSILCKVLITLNFVNIYHFVAGKKVKEKWC